MSSTYKTKIAQKARLNEFMKETHPDFFQGTNPEAATANNESVSKLNEYLTSISTPGSLAKKTTLSFFLKPTEDQLKIFQMQSELKGETESKEEPPVGKIKVELLPIKSDASVGTRTQHYSKAVSTLMEALNDYWEKGSVGEDGVAHERDYYTDAPYKMKPKLSQIYGRKRK